MEVSLERLRDPGDAFGARAARHLREDAVVWLTTVDPGGAPTPSPVWFLWDGDGSALVYSLAGTSRTANLAANPRVTLNFAGDGRGGDIVVLSGLATVAEDAGPADENTGYLEKYSAHITRIGLTPREFAGRYRVPVRIRFTRLRGH